jgi:hypothetical protein
MDLKFNFQNIKAQGSTEYLVILGLVLMLGLVSVSLLSSAVGDSQDAKVAQSKALISSSAPIAITDIIARASESVLRMNNNSTLIFIALENRGQYPITLTKTLANGQEIEYFWGWKEVNFTPIRQLYNKIAPGEKFYIGGEFRQWPDTEKYVKGGFNFRDYNSLPLPEGSFPPGTADQTCSFTNYLVVKNFGFEYIEHVEGQDITKRQIWKELRVKCGHPFYWCC